MRALQLVGDRELKQVDLPPPPPPGPGEVTVDIAAVALNHIDVWGWRGMAFAKRKMPLVVGAEASGVVSAIGPGVASVLPGQLVAIYGAQTCGLCRPCREGRDNLCEHVSGVHGFHLDGFAQEKVNLPARLLVPAPPGCDAIGAALAPVTFGTVEHMLFDNAKLEPGETPEATLIRELREELGIETKAACLAPLTFASHSYDDFHLLMPLYVCRRYEGIAMPREAQRLKWVRPAQLRDYPMPPADEPLIPHLIELL